jgi:hypothetical protein
MEKKISIFAFVALKMIRWYKNKLSRYAGVECLFTPTCSEYAELAIKKYGFFKGIVMGFKRIKRCVPGSGGEDYP